MTKYTIKDFRRQYPTDAACLDKIFKIRYGSIIYCPECTCETEFRRIPTRRCYQCKHCYAQFYPTAGTIFEKTTTPLSDWFFAIYLFTTTRNGVSAKELERALGVTYKCAFRMGHKIRELIGGVDPEKLKGIVEIDETYMGGSISNKSNMERAEIMENQNRDDFKSPVIAMVERGGNIKAIAVTSAGKDEVHELIKLHIDKEALLNSDESLLYRNVSKELDIKHITVNHGNKEYRNGAACTNTVEGFFGHLKNAIRSTHIQVSEKHMQSYLNEFCFRYDNRKIGAQMFDRIIGHLPVVRNDETMK